MQIIVICEITVTPIFSTHPILYSISRPVQAAVEGQVSPLVVVSLWSQSETSTAFLGLLRH